MKTWEEIFDLSIKLSKKIIADYRPDIVVGIAKGGWVPARNLCDLMDINDLLSIKVSHWGKVARPSGKAEITYGLDANLRGKNVLVVDDIADTGESVKSAVKYLRKNKPKSIKSATIYHIEKCAYKPDFYGKTVKGWKWLIFPWNVTEDMERFAGELLDANPKLSTNQMAFGFRKYYNIKLPKPEILRVLNEIKRRGIIAKKGANWVNVNG